MSVEKSGLLQKTGAVLSAGGAAFSSVASPVNLLFVLLIVLAGLALFAEQFILVGMIGTLALLTGAIGAGVLAMIMVAVDKTLSPRGFSFFLAVAFVIPLTLWSSEIFNDLPDRQWLYVALLAAIMLLCALYLVPRLHRAYRAKGVMAE